MKELPSSTHVQSIAITGPGAEASLLQAGFAFAFCLFVF